VNLEVFVFAPSDRCPTTANLLCLDASLAIPMHVLHFKDFGLRSHPSVRPVQCCSNSVFSSSVLALWINQGTQWFSGERPETPQTRCSLRQSPLMTQLPCSLGSTLVFEAQPRNRPWLYLAILATMQPAHDPAGHRVPQTKPTCLLHTWRPHRNDLSCMFVTCTNINQAATCTCNT
jgi:hypothetical protein